MQFVAVDWSGDAKYARRHIWTAIVRSGDLVELEDGRDREELAAFLATLARVDEQTVIGLDFAFSMPEWFLRQNNLGSAHELWDLAAREGERWLAESPPPFWGRKGTHPPEPALRSRVSERSIPATAGNSPKSVFQIAGGGAVGTGTIRGLPLLAMLSRAGFSIWPFDPPGWPRVVEIYPRLLTGPVRKSDQGHRDAYMASDRWTTTSQSLRTLAASTEDAFDAAVSAFIMAEHAQLLTELGEAKDESTRLEGQIWYPANLAAHKWSVPASAAPKRRPDPGPLVEDLPAPGPTSSRPFSRTFWVESGRLLAGAYPGHQDPVEASKKLGALKRAGVGHIVNLTDPRQPGHDGAALRPYIAAAQILGISVARWPITDVSVPSIEEMTEILNDIDLALARGQTVYAHCWGGRGRTGTVVGCWLVRHRARPEEALRRLEALKEQGPDDPSFPYPENQAQLNFVRQWRAGTTLARATTSSSPTKWSRVRGMILGGAIGDALGAGIEFQTLDEIRHRYGTDGVTDYVEAYGGKGTITDDTQMTLFTAEALLRTHNRFLIRGIASTRDVARFAYLRWLKTQGEQGPDPAPGADLPAGWLVEQEVLHHRRAPGNTCLAALRSGGDGSIEKPINNSKGCGTVMRIAPMALLPDRVFDQSCEVAALTHGHPSGYLAAGALAVILNRVIDGESLPEAIESAKAELRTHAGHDEVTRAIEAAQELAWNAPLTPENVQQLGAGWVAEEALSIAIFCALKVGDRPGPDAFRIGVLAAVNHGGDSDSTGAITGNLLGAMLGVGALPGEWCLQLEAKELVTTIADDLARHFVPEARPPSWPPPTSWPVLASWPEPDDLGRYPGT